MTPPITSFARSGPYGFCSNFFSSEEIVIEVDGFLYHNTELPYQIAKFTDPELRLAFQGLTPGQSKALARAYYKEVRPDWHDVNIGVMRGLLEQKFRPGTQLSLKLVSTGDAHICEGNYWHDQYWGNCTCGKKPECAVEGLNHLGTLLMHRRMLLRTSFV
jgi:ribA/ribD-fused uncharacterized protein